MSGRDGVTFWTHRGLHHEKILARDGVHVQHQHKYWRSVRGAIIRNIHQ